MFHFICTNCNISTTNTPLVSPSDGRISPPSTSQMKQIVCTNQYPRTQQKFDGQPSRSRHMVDAYSWPFRCGRFGRYRVGWARGTPIQSQSVQSPQCPIPSSSSINRSPLSVSYLWERVCHTAGRAIGGQDADSRTGSHLEGLMTLS